MMSQRTCNKNLTVIHVTEISYLSCRRECTTVLCCHPADVFVLLILSSNVRVCHLSQITKDFHMHNLSLVCVNTMVHTLKGTTVAQWLRCCATNWKVAGSIPAGVSGFFIDIKSFRSHYGPGVNSASNRNEYQEYFLGVKAAGA